MIWGCVALLFVSFLFVFSLERVVRLTGHEFFRKTHYVVAGELDVSSSAEDGGLGV